MKSFLQYVAEDILHKYGTDLSRITIIFPNKRASLFLNEELVRLSNKPLWSPNYLTISELFRAHSSKSVGDQIKLICDLHKIFNECTGSDETLDHFYGWGQVLLADYDDIDKNMGDAHLIFKSIKDIHEFDDASYLNDEQKGLLKKFFANFTEDITSKLKERFINLWSNFEEIYTKFNERLSQQGLAYEGALYREVVGKEQLDFHSDIYIFVGFNMMQ
ncbi:MAG: PD-(D/E)XK nuclease family protein, partial [Prevotella salivae]|nr:PD-(D/E)XK nuclease family protein [Segatella salivae]